MDIGKLDQRIDIQALTEANNGGELTRTYASIGETWAKVKSMRLTENFETGRINARETIKVYIRYRDDVTDKHRITWQGQDYNVIGVDRSLRRVGAGYIWMTCEVVGAE